MTCVSSTRGLPGLPRGRCGLSASQASSDNQNKLFAMTIAAPATQIRRKYTIKNQLTVWVLNLSPFAKVVLSGIDATSSLR